MRNTAAALSLSKVAARGALVHQPPVSGLVAFQTAQDTGLSASLPRGTA